MPEDTNKVNLMNILSDEYRRMRNKAALSYCQRAYELSRKIDFERGKGESAFRMGRYYGSVNDSSKAINNYKRAESIYKKIAFKKGIAACSNNIGIVYLNWSNFEQAKRYFTKSLALYSALDDKNEMAGSSINLGISYENLGYLSKALSYYFEALKLDESTGYKEGEAYDYNAIAIVYKKKGDLLKALEFHKKALSINREMKSEYDEASTLVNVSMVYKELGRFDEALSALNKSLKTFEALDHLRGQTITLHNIGAVYLKQSKPNEAIKYFNQSLKAGEGSPYERSLLENLAFLADAYIKSNDADRAVKIASKALPIAEEKNSIEHLSHLNRILYDVYKLKNNHKAALYHYEYYISFKDSLAAKEKDLAYKELQTKYETQKKEQQIELLNKEKTLQAANIEKKTLLQYFLMGLIFLVVVFSVILIIVYRKRQNAKRMLLSEQLKNKKIEAERLLELDHLKSRFFANIAHEFRTPLTLITGPVENLLEEVRNKYYKDQLTLVKKNASRLLRLINQLLDLSKLESGITKLELSKQDFISFIKGITFSFQSLADEKDIRLEIHSDIDSRLMDFDRDKLEKIMYNLLSNAFKFTPQLGKISVVLDKIKKEEKDWMRVKISDTGVGIPGKDLPMIFNRFYQSDNAQTRNVEGSGIGLALTKELVELHGGEIMAESVLGISTSIYFTLPIKNQETVEISFTEETNLVISEIDDLIVNAPLSERPEALLGMIEKSEIVLVIEDNAEVRNFIRSSLSGAYQILEASNGDEGLLIAKEQVPDIIISDVMMPGKDGYETCRLLKQDEKTSHIPVILLTAKSGIESKLEGLETGADDYLSKPFNTRELLVRIKNLLTSRKKLREKYLDIVLENKANEKVAPIEDAFLTRIREIVESHLDDELFSIEDLSREVGMSRTQVHRKLKALTNQSASQFMRMVRLHHAKSLLKKGRYNVSEVAYKVGFNSSTYFSTCYAEFYGYAPSEENS